MTLTRLTVLPALLATTALLSGGGCGPSPEEAIIAKNRARPKPGWVRLVNFSSRPLELWVDGRPVTGEIAPENASGFSGFSPKDHKFVVKSGGSDLLNGTLDTKSELGTTVVAIDPGGKLQVKVASGEPRVIPKGSNKLVVFDATGHADGFEVKDDNGMSVKVVSGGLSEAAEPMSLDSKFNLVQGGKTIAVAQVRLPMEANTGFIVPGPKPRLVIFGNSPKSEPLKNADFN